MGIGVMVAVLGSTGKLSTAIRPKMILARLGTKKTAILFKNSDKMLCGSKPP